MVRLITYSGLILSLTLAMALISGSEGVREKPKPKKERCKDKSFPNCYKKDHYCPDQCLRDCFVDCKSCKPVCYRTSPPPPPPPPPRSPPSPVNASPPPPSPPSPENGSPPPSPPSPENGSPPPSPPSPENDSPPPPPPPPSPENDSPPPSPPSPENGSPPPSPPSPETGSPPPSPPSPDQSEAAGNKRVRCRDKKYPSCYNSLHTCPVGCPTNCQVNCLTCKPECGCDRPGSVCQDPRFVGGDGLTFYFHGKKDRHFCLVSDAGLHINALFIGKRSPTMTRDFTWISALGLLFGPHTQPRNLSISALKTPSWDASLDHLSLSLDGSPVSIPPLRGAMWKSPPGSSPAVRFMRADADANSVEVEVEGLVRVRVRVVPITAEDSRIHKYGVVDGEDCFAHLDVGFTFYRLTSHVGGVLGQTYAEGYVSRVKMGVPMPVLGGDREFAASGLFQPDCTASRFVGDSGEAEGLEAVGMDCGGSDVEARGVVCKR